MLIKTIKAWNRKRLGKRLHRKSGVPHLPVDAAVLRARLGNAVAIQAGLRLAVCITEASRTSGRQWHTCLQSLEQAARRLTEVPVVAVYGGTVGAAASSQGHANSLHIVNLPPGPGLGRAGSLNALMAAALAEGCSHLLCIKSDCLLEPDALLHLVQMSAAADHSALIEGTQFPDELPKYFNPQTLETPWASDACLLMPARIHHALQGFDEAFTGAGGDVDLSWRARAMGWRVLTCPTALFGYLPNDATRLDHLDADHAEFCLRLLKDRWQGGGHADQRTVDDALALQRKPGIADFSFGTHFALNRW